MKVKNIEPFRFLTYNENNIEVLFSTAWNKADFSQSTHAGRKTINLLKELLGLKEMGYLKQIHSNKIHIYDGVIEEGDSLITNKANIGIGVFTADCVPVILIDTENKVISTVHSGWKGTYNELVAETIDKMILDYGSKEDNIKVFIGPHIKECCYEVSEELIKSFYNKEIYKNKIIAKGRNLNLEKCVTEQCMNRKIPKENVHSVGFCTYCSKDYEFYSYRKDKECGRLFSMAFIKE